MQKFLTTLVLCCLLTTSFGQSGRKAALYLQGQYNQTLSDITLGNNPWGMGLGLQVFFGQAFPLKPTLELTADAYLMDDKVYRMYPDETPIRTVDGMVNLFVGASYHPGPKTYFSFVAGPSFVGGQTLLGVKPTVGFYFSSRQRITGKVSFINVFSREPRAKENFSSVSISLGARLF